MKRCFLSFSLFLYSCISFAGPSSEELKLAFEAQPHCGNFVSFDAQNIYLGFGPYKNGVEEPRNPIPSRLRVASILDSSSSFDLATSDAALGAERIDNSLFVLTYSGLEEWDLAEKRQVAVHPTYFKAGPMAYKEHALGFARFQDKLIIAHGRLGVSFFDLNKKRITNQFRLLTSQLPLESMATAATVQGNYAYVVMDNFSLVANGKPPFRGIVVIDMRNEAVVATLEGMDPGVTSIVSDSRTLLIGLGGMTTWKYSLSTIGGDVLVEPVLRVWRYGIPGNPLGAPAMDEKYLYTCFYRSSEKPGQPGKRAPIALNRAALMLN